MISCQLFLVGNVLWGMIRGRLAPPLPTETSININLGMVFREGPVRNSIPKFIMILVSVEPFPLFVSRVRGGGILCLLLNRRVDICRDPQWS
jgi:hypothetical protein